MVRRHRFTGIRKWAPPSLLAGVLVLVIASAVGAAERVVLGEYFTNFF